MTENCGTPASASLKALAQMMEAGAKAGIDILKSLYGSAPEALGGLANLASNQYGGGGCCSCEIPPPCWMPRQLCEVVSYGKAGNASSITLVITNESMAHRVISVMTTTSITGLVFSANSLTLGPMERGEIEVTYTIPTTIKSGPGTEILLWIQGCKLHFLRWTIKLGPISADTNYEVCVNDGPENVHHWYDHFYCPRPCLPEKRVPGQ
jgi:hypothetical protein